MKHFALNIKFLRERINKKQNEIEADLGFKSGVLSNYERGKSMPSVENLYRISKYFQVSIDALLKVDLAKESEQANEPKQIHTASPHSNILRIIEEEWQEVKQEMESLKERLRRLEESG